MKTRSNSFRVPVVLAAGLATACSAAAQDMDSNSGGNATGFYEGAQAGAAWIQNMSGHLGSSFGPVGTQFKFNAGPKVDIFAGYNITGNIAAELQAGFAHNSMSSFEVGGTGLPAGASSDLWSIPLMANGVYKYSFNDHWQVYGGAGAGAVISILRLRDFGTDTDTTDIEFGYQAKLGINYLFNDHLSCGVGYNFVGTVDHHWSEVGSGLSTNPTYMHAVLLTLTYKF